MRLAVFALSACFLAMLGARPALAVPSFARQTGAPCTQCHVGAFGPQLNDYGRQFKLNGYVWGDVDNKVPPVSAMALASLTHTAADQPGGAAPDYGNNDNTTLDQASLFLAGRVLSNIGAMIQATYDGVAKQFTIDNFDVRYANQGTIARQNVVFGVSVNNNPTVQDLWNSTPAWGYPFAASKLAPKPGTATAIEGGFAQQVAGVTAYSMWNDLLYLEGGVYMTLSGSLQSSLGVDPTGENQIAGAAPYWRVALQHAWSTNYVSVGTFGLDASVYPGRDASAGTDHYRDIGVDATFQKDFDERNTISASARYVHERQALTASNTLGLTDNLSDTVETANVTLSYDFDATYGATAGYFRVRGTADGGLYSPNPIDGSLTEKPNSTGYMIEARYTPFGKDGSWLSPWINLRLGLQCVAYSKFNGASMNYDGFGRNARDNNTLFAYAWLIF